MCSSIPIFSSFSHCTTYPLFPWIREPDQVLKAGPKVFCKGSSDSRDPVVALFLNRKLDRWFHSCICQCVLYLCRLTSWSWALLQGALGMWQPPVRVQVSVCSVSVASVATRIAANCIKLLSVICGSGDYISRYFPYFLFPQLFIFFFGKDLCQIVMEGSLKYIRGSSVFVYTNFFFSIPVFFYKRTEKWLCAKEKKSSWVELKYDSTKLPAQICERQETRSDDQ